MPELPEVETIRRTLAPRLVGRTIERVEVRTPKFIVGATPEAFRRAVEGATIASVGRRGKYLGLGLGEAATAALPGDIVIHLKMAGQLVWCLPETDLGPTRTKHTHVVFHLDDGHELRFLDLRHFGRVYFPAGDPDDPVLRRALATMANLGPEPLGRDGAAPTLDYETFRAKLARRGARVKPLLLDQAFLAGLGNIYADESLFRARIHPLRRASTITDEEARALFEAIHAIIAEAVGLRGTSIRDYVDGEGQRGEFAQRLQVYGRKGEACPRCGASIERLVIGGRSAHFCPECQSPTPEQTFD